MERVENFRISKNRMARGNPGYMLKITQGVHAGKYAIARHKEQNESFRRLKKLSVHLYEDELCRKPIGHTEKKIGSLIQAEFCEIIGMID